MSSESYENQIERKVKSLNDIAEVFGTRDNKIRSLESEISKFYTTSTAEFYKELNRSIQNARISRKGENEKTASDSTNDEENDHSMELAETSKSLNVDLDMRLSNDSKTSPLDVPNLTDALLEEENHKRNSTHVSRKRLKMQKRILSIGDSFLSMILITPLAVGFWKGTWTMMDLHAEWFPGVFCFLFGVLLHTSFAIFKNFLQNRVGGTWRKKTCSSVAFSKFAQISYTYIFGVACILQWRGGWIVFDWFFSGHIWITMTTMLIVLTSLTILRSVRNLIAVPTVVFVDERNYVFWFPTRYKLNTRDWSLYLLDCAFSVAVVGTLVVFVWRGVWILFDLYLFPDDRKYSAIGSLAIGYVIVTVTFSLQPLMRYACARLQGLARLVAADGFLLLSFLGTVNVWRGIWNVLDLWLVPDNPELSCWITHVGCFVFLVLLNCSNSILVRGVYIDAEEEDGKCVAFPCHYLRLFFKVEREKKEARRRNLLVASKDFRPRADANANANAKDTENGALLPNSTTATSAAATTITTTTTILPTNPESLV